LKFSLLDTLEIEMSPTTDDLDEIEKATTNSNFLKWADAPFVLQFREGPEIRTLHWLGGQPKDCSGKGCQSCATGDDPRTSFLYTVYVYSNSSGEVNEEASFDISQNAQRHLIPLMREFANKHGQEVWRSEFAVTAIKCEKHGHGNATGYSFVEVPKVELEPLPF
jgi:hypothetical protein